jgi:hypothetical protein
VLQVVHNGQNLDSLNSKIVSEQQSESEVPHSFVVDTKAKLLRRFTPVQRSKHVEELECIICGLARKKYKGIDQRTKYRICESERANTFLSAASFFQDDVFCRVSDLNSEFRVFAADLYDHPNCMRGYLQKYEYAMQQPSERQESVKFDLFKTANEVLEPLFNTGYGFTLTELRELKTDIDDSIVLTKSVYLAQKSYKYALKKTAFKFLLYFSQKEKEILGSSILKWG